MSITMGDMIDPNTTAQAHISVETRPHAQAHTMLEETVNGIALYNYYSAGGPASVDRCTLEGAAFALKGELYSGGFRIGASKVVGAIGPLYRSFCVGCYNESFAPLNEYCLP